MAHYRVGVIGGGGGRGRSWANRVARWPKNDPHQLELVGIADILEIARNRAAERFGCKVYTDYVEMMDKENPDIVIVATPHYVHAPQAIAAAERGIHVYCEKPMCINLPQADEMAAAVEKSRIKLAVGFQHRFDPIYVALRNAVKSGDIGEVFQINAIYHWWRKEDYYLNSSPVPENKDLDWEGWKGHWPTEGGGAIANQIMHHIDLFQWISPSPVQSVFASSRVAKHTLVETDDNTSAIVEFQNGSMGFIQAGVAYQHDRDEVFGVYGTEGAIVHRKNDKGLFGIPRFFEDYRKKALKKAKRMWSYVPSLKINLNKAVMDNFINAVANDDANSISVDVNEGRKSIELLRAILLSQVHGKKITFPFDDKPTDYPALQHTYQDKDLV
ncbi:MAG: Gfo/Idh/MocA family oxidoreductase [Candidatus Lokiarchaeota archaeon]|nr:Gfo/Idh/MocA family oxidoreductase [Candidatus Lokiarchaeota archaeon]